MHIHAYKYASNGSHFNKLQIAFRAKFKSLTLVIE